MSGCVLNVVSGIVWKFRFSREEVGCSVAGEFYSIDDMLLCFRACCIICLCS